MKKENIALLAFSLMMVLFATLMIWLQTSFVVSTPLEKLFDQKITLSKEERPSDRPNTILSRQKVFNKKGEEIAVLYVGAESNSFGVIELYVAVIDNKVYAIDKKLDQTEKLDFTRNYLLENYQGLTYLNIEYVDGAAGATTVSYSRDTIKHIVQVVADYHFGPKIPPVEPEKPDYISQILNLEAAAYTKETIGTSILKHTITITASKTVQIVYEYKKSVSYSVGSQTSGDITLFVLIDDSGKVLKVLMPIELYGHTKDDRTAPNIKYGHAASNAYVQQMIGKNITDELAIPSGATTGNTVSGLQLMLEEIAEVYRNEN